MSVKHIKVRKRNWLLTIVASILIGLFIVVLVVGIVNTMYMFGLAKPQQTVPFDTNVIFIISWVFFSIMTFLELSTHSDYLTYEAIEHG